MPDHSVDISENDFLPDILELLLRDHTTGRHIFWATHDYEQFGDGYQYADEIRPENITDENGKIIKPRVLKTKEQQTDRSRDMAEVFTPSWVVKKMVNYVDIEIKTRCLELTCGEAPFLVSRYDATTGEPIDINERVGILDRKLRMVNDQRLSDEDWLAQVRQAFQSTYGYEWQGDSLLLARENLFYTFVEHYEARYGCTPDIGLLQEFAEIISWNLWQMDGLTYRIPSEKKEEPQDELSLFNEGPAETPPPFCIIMDWQKGKTFKVNDIKKRLTKNQNNMKFDVIIGNPPYQEETIGENETYAPQIYDKFLEESYKVAESVLMIHPGRFLFNAGSTSKAWNKKMLNDPHFKILHYESNTKKIFPNSEITGGIAISYHDEKHQFGAIGVFTSFMELNMILKKVTLQEGFESFKNIVISRTVYRLTDKLHKDYPNAVSQLSKGHAYDMSSNIFERLPHIFYEEIPNDGFLYIRMLGRCDGNRAYRYIRRDYVNNVINLEKYKIVLARADGAAGTIGNPIPARVIGNPTIEPPMTGTTESFLSIGSFTNKNEAKAALLYVKTKFVRTLLSILKTTQDITPDKWAYVPLQDFTPSSDIDWSKTIPEIDKQLYRKYGLTKEEIEFIETKVKEMN
ncbi:MAG: Eco57I restriction-modification methylase domain-containing protein [Prevotella sp.]|nr:Eco57I restriction-modification methylase domain-containing protein [Prevotella sp.]